MAGGRPALDAIKDFFRGLAGRRSRRPERLEFAAALFRGGQLAEANGWCERVLRADPDNVEARLLCAEIALSRGDKRNALLLLQETHSLGPGEVGAQQCLGMLFARAGDAAKAAEVLRESLRRGRDALGHLCALSEAEEALGHYTAAAAAYDSILAQSPGESRIFTRRATMMMRQAWGAPLPAPPEKRQEPGLERRIMMSRLGTMGRFGMQVQQYMALRVYGRIHRLAVEVPDWPGRWLFDLDDPYPGSALPEFRESPGGGARLFSGEAAEIFSERDFSGYFYCPTQYYLPHCAFLQTLFRPGERARPPMEEGLSRLRRQGRTLVALHIRRGDKVEHKRFWVAPLAPYLAWLDAIWQELDAPVLYVASDDPQIHREFREFAPATAGDLGVSIPGAEFFTDFYVLTQADLLAISPSSFSFTASMLNTTARQFLRPPRDSGQLVPFDPWNSPRPFDPWNSPRRRPEPGAA